MTDVIKFPGATGTPVCQEHSEDKRHAEAFRDMEGRLSDCVHMAGIAAAAAERAIEGRETKHERAMFAVFHVSEMLRTLQKDYHAAWHGEQVQS